MKNKYSFDCPVCSVFMEPYSKENELPRFICPICKSIFLPSPEAIKQIKKTYSDSVKQVEAHLNKKKIK